MRPEPELAWAAGLYEGEGCLSLHANAQGRLYPRLTLQMDDDDVVRRFADVVGVGTVNGPHGPYGTSKKKRTQWKCSKPGEIAHFLMAVKDYLGQRRREQIKRVVRERRRARREYNATRA